ncbi:hypothetical protein ACFYO1_02325 [Nocardia sp. NPDC006044]|uniref:hypothetical protein n=1 Tax=Nocardia sp. NPDC006044 TaxID=3364306 RepID=UPI00369BB5AB
MSLFGDIIGFAAGAIGFAVGGPVGAALLGGVVGGVINGIEHDWDFGAVVEGVGLGAAGGLIGGGVGGLGFKTAFKGGIGLTKASATGGARGLFNNGVRGALPNAWRGAQEPMEHSLGGMISAGFGPKRAIDAPGMIEDFFHQIAGYPEIPTIPISPKTAPPDMPLVYMPDPNHMPDGVQFSRNAQAHYDPPVYQLLMGNWACLGSGPKPDRPENLWAIPAIKGAELAQIANYSQLIASLEDVYQKICDADGAVATVIERAADLSKDGRKQIGDLINRLAEWAKTNPADMGKIGQYIEAKEWTPDAIPTDSDGALSEDILAMTLIASVTIASSKIMQSLADKAEEYAAAVDEQKPSSNENPGPSLGEDPKQDPQRDPKQPPPAVLASGDPNAPRDTAVNLAADSIPLPKPWEWEDVGSHAGNEQAVIGADPASTSVLPPVVSTPSPSVMSAANPATPPSTPSALPTGSAVPVGFGDYGLPMQLRQPAARADSGTRKPAVSDHARTADRRVSTGQIRDGAAQPPSGTTAPPSTTQQSAALDKAGKSTGSPVSASIHARDTDEKGVPYMFPDGRLQIVSVVVRQALSAAFSNTAGTDARAAYAMTSLPLPAGDEIGERVDPNQLNTGDVAVWVDETGVRHLALMAVFRGDAGTSAEVIIDGTLRPFDDETIGKQLGSSVFDGFSHPRGIEIPMPGQGASSAVSITPESIPVSA